VGREAVGGTMSTTDRTSGSSSNDLPTPAGRYLRPTAVATAAARGVVACVEFAGFWLAVALPVGYALLLHDGLSGGEPVEFCALLAVHLLALLVGRGYNEATAYDHPGSPRRDRDRSA